MKASKKLLDPETAKALGWQPPVKKAYPQRPAKVYARQARTYEVVVRGVADKRVAREDQCVHDWVGPERVKCSKCPATCRRLEGKIIEFDDGKWSAGFRADQKEIRNA